MALENLRIELGRRIMELKFKQRVTEAGERTSLISKPTSGALPEAAKIPKPAKVKSHLKRAWRASLPSSWWAPDAWTPIQSPPTCPIDKEWVSLTVPLPRLPPLRTCDGINSRKNRGSMYPALAS